MRVVADLQLCEGNAECMRIAPEVFRVSDDDQVQILAEHPAEPLRARVEAAVRRCPRQALAIRDD